MGRHRVKRVPGPATQVHVYRYRATPGARRSDGRVLMANLQPDPALEQALPRVFGAGTYRLEWKDARGWLVKVAVRVVEPSGRVGPPPPRVQPPRRVPMPEPLPSEPVRTPLLVEGTAGLDPDHEDDATSSRWLPGPPEDRSDLEAVARWAWSGLMQLRRIARYTFAQLDLVEAMDLEDCGPLARTYASELIELDATVTEALQRLPEIIENSLEVSIWVEDLHQWACAKIDRAFDIVDWALATELPANAPWTARSQRGRPPPTSEALASAKRDARLRALRARRRGVKDDPDELLFDDEL